VESGGKEAGGETAAEVRACRIGCLKDAGRAACPHQDRSGEPDSTIVKVHPDGTGALKKGPQAIGKSSAA
jgi:hypothetical protein